MLPGSFLFSEPGEWCPCQGSRSVCKMTILPRLLWLQALDNLEAQSRPAVHCTGARCSFWPGLQGRSNSSLQRLLEDTFLTSTYVELVLPSSYSCHCMSSSQMANCSIWHRLDIAWHKFSPQWTSLGKVVLRFVAVCMFSSSASILAAPSRRSRSLSMDRRSSTPAIPRM